MDYWLYRTQSMRAARDGFIWLAKPQVRGTTVNPDAEAALQQHSIIPRLERRSTPNMRYNAAQQKTSEAIDDFRSSI